MRGQTAAYDTVLNLVSDASVELGLGTQTAVYSSTDPNVIQLYTLLKQLGRKLVLERNWTHLQKEYTFVTYPAWAKSTAYTSAAVAWAQNTAYAVGDMRTANSNLYQCTTAGTSNVNGVGPNTNLQSITDGTCVWKYLNAGAASIVTKGLYYYTCTGSGTSGTTGPYRAAAGTETDGTVTWTWGGNGADFALPSDFARMIDQSQWNRTNRLPVGGPLSPEEWQYLEGRLAKVVFNVVFRPVQGLMRLFPDSDTPGGYLIAFEYASNSWVSATGGTSPTTNAPTADTDIIYFDPLLITRGLKLSWLKTKGMPTEAAQQAFDEIYERIKNSDGAAPVLNLRGRTPFDPLLGIQNVPITNYGAS